MLLADDENSQSSQQSGFEALAEKASKRSKKQQGVEKKDQTNKIAKSHFKTKASETKRIQKTILKKKEENLQEPSSSNLNETKKLGKSSRVSQVKSIDPIKHTPKRQNRVHEQIPRKRKLASFTREILEALFDVQNNR